MLLDTGGESAIDGTMAYSAIDGGRYFLVYKNAARGWLSVATAADRLEPSPAAAISAAWLRPGCDVGVRQPGCAYPCADRLEPPMRPSHAAVISAA